MDPADVIKGIRVTAAIAGALLRGISALFGIRKIHPYRYYRLGSLIQRWEAGKLARLSQKDRDAVWQLGIQGISIPPALPPQQQIEWMRRQAQSIVDRGWITGLAPALLAQKGISFLLKFTKPPPFNQPFWDWLELGRAEYRDRWVPKARAILGEDPAAFWAKRSSSQRAYEVAFNVWRETKSAYWNMKWQEALRVAKPIADKHEKAVPALRKAWRDTPAVHALKSGTAAQNELNRWIASRKHAGKEAIEDALWFGSPVPWALELAAQAYGQHGPAAVIQYASVSKSVTHDLRILLKRIAPAAMSDPMLAPFLR